MSIKPHTLDNNNLSKFKLKSVFFQKWNTAQKMKFSIKDFFSKCDEIRDFQFPQLH